MCFVLQEIDSEDDNNYVGHEDLEGLNKDEMGRLQYCQKVKQHSTHEMSGWTEDKRMTDMLHKRLRGKLVAKVLHCTDAKKCSLLDGWLKVNLQREVVDICMDVSCVPSQLLN